MAFFDEIAKRQGQIITFTSVATGKSVSFPAFITQFSDNYSVSWGGGTSFGRVDPIKNYQSTSRRVNLGFDVLGKDAATAKLNFSNFSKLVQMLYPVYSDPVGPNTKSRTIRAAPLMRIKYANYLRSETSPHGLLGCIGGFNFAPKFQSGHLIDESTGEMLPLVYDISFVFEPLHEAPLGSDEVGEFLSGKFPYNQDSTPGQQRVPAGDPVSGD